MDSRRRTLLSQNSQPASSQQLSSQDSNIPYPPSAIKSTKSRFNFSNSQQSRLSVLPSSRQSLLPTSSQDNFIPSASRADSVFHGRQSLVPRIPPTR